MAADHPTEGEDVKQYPCSYPGCEKYIKVQMHSGHIKKLGTIL